MMVLVTVVMVIVMAVLGFTWGLDKKAGNWIRLVHLIIYSFIEPFSRPLMHTRYCFRHLEFRNVNQKIKTNAYFCRLANRAK